MPEEVKDPNASPANKVPSFTQFVKYPLQGALYLLVLYFVYKEFIARDDCSKRIETLEMVIKDKDMIIKQINARVQVLERAIDVKNGVIDRVNVKLDSITQGGSK